MTASWVALGIVVAGAVALVAGGVLGLDLGVNAGALVGIVAMVALLVWLGPGLLGRYYGRGGQALQHAALWLAIVVVILALYRYGGALFPGF
jgi:hypothetical protein